MKKVRVTLNQDSPGKKLYLFPSAEALYVWASALERGEALEIQGIEEVLLEQGDFAEAELLGFEYIYENGGFRRLDLIRLGKAKATQNAAGLQVTTHVGWVTGNLLPLRHYTDDHVSVNVIADGEHQLDLAKLFHDEIQNDEQ